MVTATDVGFEASTTFVTEVSPELIDGFGADGVLGAGEPLPLMGEHEGLLGEGSPHADPGGVEQQAWLCGS